MRLWGVGVKNLHRPTLALGEQRRCAQENARALRSIQERYQGDSLAPGSRGALRNVLSYRFPMRVTR
jgi:hypothetical protein